MYVIAKSGTSTYRVDMAAAVKLENETSSFRELHPEIPGSLYIIRLYYDPGNVNIYTDLAAYDNFETAFRDYAEFIEAVVNGWPMYDFSGLIFDVKNKEPDKEEEQDLMPE